MPFTTAFICKMVTTLGQVGDLFEGQQILQNSYIFSFNLRQYNSLIIALSLQYILWALMFNLQVDLRCQHNTRYNCPIQGKVTKNTGCRAAMTLVLKRRVKYST